MTRGLTWVAWAYIAAYGEWALIRISDQPPLGPIDALLLYALYSGKFLRSSVLFFFLQIGDLYHFLVLIFTDVHTHIQLCTV